MFVVSAVKRREKKILASLETRSRKEFDDEQ